MIRKFIRWIERKGGPTVGPPLAFLVLLAVVSAVCVTNLFWGETNRKKWKDDLGD